MMLLFLKLGEVKFISNLAKIYTANDFIFVAEYSL